MNTLTDQQTKRLEAYKKLLEANFIDPSDKSTSAGEDAAMYLEHPERIERFAVHTMAGEWDYVTAESGTLERAKARAIANIDDDIFAETPIKIVDLDTGMEWKPSWSAMPWRMTAEGLEATK